MSEPQFVAFDLETTGVDPFKDVPVSYAIIGASYEDCNFIYPGRRIPVEASQIHGISDAMVKDAMTVEEGVIRIVDCLHFIWRNVGVIVGMNVSYDLTMITSLCKQLNLDFHVGPVLDVLVLDRHYDKWRKGSRKLIDLARYYGVNLENAHSAKFDCLACLEILTAMRHRYPFNIEMADNATLRAWYQTWLSEYSTYCESRGQDPIPKGRYEWPVHSEGD